MEGESQDPEENDESKYDIWAAVIQEASPEKEENEISAKQEKEFTPAILGDIVEFFSDDEEENKWKKKERHPSMDTIASMASFTIKALTKENRREENELKFELETGLVAKGLFVGLVPGMVDVITDVFSVKHFTQRDFYLKISNNSHGFQKENCSLVSITITQMLGSLTEHKEETMYTFSCFETDPIFGRICFMLIFLPSVFAVGRLMFRVYKKRWMIYEKFTKRMGDGCVAVSILIFAGAPSGLIVISLFCLAYPLLTMVLKMVNMFTRNKRLNALAVHCASFEGIGESSLQFALQLYIAFTMAHRQPSTTQLVSMTASGIMVSKTLVDTEISMRYTQRGVSLSFEKEIAKSILLLPVFTSGTVGIIGSIAMSSSLLRYNYITFVTFILLLLGMDLAIHRMMGNAKSLRILVISAIASQFLLQSVLLIIANVSPDTSLSKFFKFKQDPYKLNSMPIVQNSLLFNYVEIGIMVCQAISLILYYLQIYKPWMEGKRNEENQLAEYDQGP